MNIRKPVAATAVLTLSLGLTVGSVAMASATDEITETAPAASESVETPTPEVTTEETSTPVQTAPEAVQGAEQVYTPAAQSVAAVSPATVPAAAPESIVIDVWEGSDVQWPKAGQKLIHSEAGVRNDAGYDWGSVKGRVADKLKACTVYQFDAYADDKVTANLNAGGVLYGPGNPKESWPGGGYNSYESHVFKTDCAPPPAQYSVQIGAYCGNADASLENQAPVGSETATVELFVDNVKVETLVAEGGQLVKSTPLKFAEDSGKHLVQLRLTDGTVLTEQTVESDCELPEKPEPTVKTETTHSVDCASGVYTETVTTTTTDWVLDGRTWVETSPEVVSTSSQRPATAEEIASESCPVVVTPPAPSTPVSASTPLVTTGADSGPALIGAALLFSLGAAAFVIARIRGRRKSMLAAE